MSAEIHQQLKDWFSNATRVVIAGVGNPIRNDDFIGTKIVQHLQNKVSDNVCLIECETVPENYLLEIEEFKPSHILLIDAAMLDIAPGKTLLVFPEQMPDGGSTFNTHILPLQMFSYYIQKFVGSKFALLLIQPKNVELGETVTFELTKTAEKIENILTELLSQF
ncbi:MAG: hydrogenase maturation protease [Candidatus Bathyarchaeota archaeon]|nr:hydrogenase maturation protease [Candidatus Termiticorpusculum sp.]